MPRDGVVMKTPASGAMLTLLVWSRIPPETLLSHTLCFHAYTFPNKRSHPGKGHIQMKVLRA